MSDPTISAEYVRAKGRGQRVHENLLADGAPQQIVHARLVDVGKMERNRFRSERNGLRRDQGESADNGFVPAGPRWNGPERFPIYEDMPMRPDRGP